MKITPDPCDRQLPPRAERPFLRDFGPSLGRRHIARTRSQPFRPSMKMPIPVLATTLIALAGLLSLQAQTGAVVDPPERDQRGLRPMLTGNIERPLRYTPEGGDFVIRNGPEFFNRSLYGGSSSFRVDGGDRPEFSLYLPGRGGNLRLGIVGAKGLAWLHDAASIEARYRAGTMVYRISDPRLGPGELVVTAMVTRAAEGLILQLDSTGLTTPAELLVAFGGINGVRGGRDGDIGCEPLPVREFFQLKPEYCRDNEVIAGADSFLVRAKAGTILATVPPGARIQVADSAHWNDLSTLLRPSPALSPGAPIAVARSPLRPGGVAYLALQHFTPKDTPPEVLAIYQKVAEGAVLKAPSVALPWAAADLPALFAQESETQRAIAGRVTIDTPDPFLNAAVPALNIAADAVWDDRQSAYLHGGVAWRVRLLGWRVGYAGDALGRHERTRAHFDGYAARQNTSPIPDAIPAPEASANLARNETALHSNGDMTKSHYDMNMVGVDVFFRHLLWTGDLDYARARWPVIERHLAWERRLFRREFGAEMLPLYEAYACIWASDDLTYHGGGATHSSAYNLYHNRMAARVARLIGVDPAPYEREAKLIERGMSQHLWLGDRGWFAEWKDLLGLQLQHPEAAAWTYYHTIDSEVPTPLEAWQMSRAIETRLPHIPLRGPGVPEGNSTLSTTNWMPYTWSLNNVVLGETVHTALALWQAGRPETAYPLLKGALLDSMYLGICPGNVGMCTWFDCVRRESQRDFADGVGVLARTMVEGLFGVIPDLLAGELHVRPGFPADWGHARMHHPDFDVGFVRKGEVDEYTVEARLARPVTLRLEVPAWRDDVASVSVNGESAAWRAVDTAVGRPRLEVVAAPASRQVVTITWRGRAPAAVPREIRAVAGTGVVLPAEARVMEIADPQQVLRGPKVDGRGVSGVVAGTAGHRTLFARVEQGCFTWWQPLPIEVVPATVASPVVFTTDWTKKVPQGQHATVPLEAVFNDRVSQIFRNEYLSPRSTFCSLAVPKQGFGSWCKPTATFDVDDSGLRAHLAREGNRLVLPNGVPLASPGAPAARNIAFVSQWDNFPREIAVPLTGRAAKAYLLMAGSTWAMQSRIDNGEIIVTYADGTTTRFALENPSTWWPIDQDYFIDDFAFARPGALPLRVDLKTGRVRVLDAATFAGKGRRVDGGAATVLDLTLDPRRELRSITVRALANEVVIGLMSVTLERP